ncbi:MAG: hypothetical protein Q9168_008442 [Polycauliona sp. 1 TL-2023]
MQAQNIYAIPGDIVTESIYRTYIADNKCNSTRTGDICVAGQQQGSGNGAPKIVYWSPTTSRSYEIRTKNGNPKISVNDLVNGINRNGFASAEILFDGNYNCTRDGRAGGRIVDVVPGEEVGISCLSQLPMYLPCGKPCPEGSVWVDGKCPFGHWENCGDIAADSEAQAKGLPAEEAEGAV